jgi:mono/diheme cytochrome c family protein
MLNILSLAAMVVSTALLVWAGIRAWRVRNRFLKWGGVGLAAVLVVVVSSASALTLVGIVKQHTRRAPVPNLQVEATPEQIARGKAIVDGFCSACHSSTGTLTGGLDAGKHFPIPVGSFVSLQPDPSGTIEALVRQRDFSRDPQRRRCGRALADGYVLHKCGQFERRRYPGVIAYIRSVPAAGEPTPDPPSRLNLLGVAMLGAGMLPSGKPVSTRSITAPPKGPTFEFGEYVLSYQDCRECHGRDLTGGVPGQIGPLGPDLNLVKQWDLSEFIATMRTGIDPNGHELSRQMPWRPLGRMDDEELAAIYEYLTRLPGY